MCVCVDIYSVSPLHRTMTNRSLQSLPPSSSLCYLRFGTRTLLAVSSFHFDGEAPMNLAIDFGVDAAAAASG